MVWCVVQLGGVADGTLLSSEQSLFSAIEPQRHCISLGKALSAQFLGFPDQDFNTRTVKREPKA